MIVGMLLCKCEAHALKMFMATKLGVRNTIWIRGLLQQCYVENNKSESSVFESEHNFKTNTNSKQHKPQEMFSLLFNLAKRQFIASGKISTN